MTREEAISEARRSTIDDCGWFHDDDIITSEQNSIALVNKIYDDFESRTCENCMHNKEQDNFMIFCDCVMCLDGSRMMWHSYTKDFCCNKWEKKDER